MKIQMVVSVFRKKIVALTYDINKNMSLCVGLLFEKEKQVVHFKWVKLGLMGLLTPV